ncbi:hypothetical protein O9X94_19015 [Agrobacterium leguminum]|uniref:Uncharacterized protein n=1 Tax=Agrobacterium leguminum TaxID=2792015 RepID=A0A9X3KGN6_9HYPH|nr:hypothetical protein [Agrobacterium leguminum]MCZ7911420.1 hypothetical protein [Agrobacterium leguminum]
MEAGQKNFEDILEGHISSNVENAILPTETIICRRLLHRRVELGDACKDLWLKANQNQFHLAVFIDGLLGVAAEWNPEKMAAARIQRDRLDQVNEKISEIAFDLAELLRERSNLHDRSGFSSETHYHVVDVINEAARDNHRFRSYVLQPLAQIRGQFDLKYWPMLPDFIGTIAVDAAKASATAHNAMTAAGTASSRPSLTDFFRAWFEHIEDHADGRLLPRQFKLTDASFASFANCALDLQPDKTVGADYVKRLRQRARDNGKQ